MSRGSGAGGNGGAEGGGSAASRVGGLGVEPEQGPPLSLPLSFFLVAPIAVMSAGVLTVWHGDMFVWRGLPWTMALVHLGTLGFLGAVMLGAIYQMLAVVASRVPLVRLGHVAHACFTIGVASLVWGFLTHEPRGFTTGWHSLATAFVLFLVPVAIALARATTRTTTVYGIMLAALGLATVVIMGAVMSRARAGGAFSGDWLTWVYGHLSIGAVVWIGGLITAVSWQVIPIFYLTDMYPRWSRLGVLAGIGATGIGVVALLATGGSAGHVVFAVLPGAFAVWIVHPMVTLVLLRGRRRKRADDSVHFWRAGLACGPLVFGLATMTWLSDHPRWPLLLGWTIVWGWAGLIIHGMLSRIVPFLVWFHRYSWLVGKTSVPPMRRLWPKQHLRVTLIAHGTTLALGLVAIAAGWRAAAVATGGGLAFTGAAVFAGLARVTWHMRGARAARSEILVSQTEPL